MSRLVIVSNRVADPNHAHGGLDVCVLDALRKRGGIWFGWNGEIASDGDCLETGCAKFGKLTFVTTPLSEREYNEYYLGFSNAALWPVHHYRLDLARFTPESVEGYRRVNERFAEMLAPLLRPDDIVWVQDYHLIPLGAALRARGVANRIGFFLHIPFPSPEVFVATPEHEWLMRAYAEYDLVGFQTKTDHLNFCRFVTECMGGRIVSDDMLQVAGKMFSAGFFPVGIDVDSFVGMAENPDAARHVRRMRKTSAPHIRVIGVDRLDYTKGLPDRLRSFKRLLELYPENCKKTALLQIAPPTREDVQAYAEIRRELEGLSGEINGELGDFDWMPVHYIHRRLSRETLAALYRASRVGLVTPLRDGMNLVAKEYVAAQDGTDPGVLVLSRFAGAAEDLEEALIVNPYDVDEVAHATQRAIAMPLAERIDRHRALLTRLRERDARNWTREFLRALDTSRMAAAA
jgi:trehalose 6-phosphate synthase